MDKEFEKRMFNAIEQAKGRPIYSVFFDEPYYLQFLNSEEELEIFQELVKDFIIRNQSRFRRDLETHPMLRKICGIDDKEYLNDEGADNKLTGEIPKDFKLEYEKITPYTILDIEEKEYTKEELLDLVGKRISYIKSKESNYQLLQQQIDDILDAYNEIIQNSHGQR